MGWLRGQYKQLERRLGWRPEVLPPSISRIPSVYNEETVREALYHNVFRPLNTVLSQGEVFDCHSLESVVGEPDFV